MSFFCWCWLYKNSDYFVCLYSSVLIIMFPFIRAVSQRDQRDPRSVGSRHSQWTHPSSRFDPSAGTYERIWTNCYSLIGLDGCSNFLEIRGMHVQLESVAGCDSDRGTTESVHCYSPCHLDQCWSHAMMGARPRQSSIVLVSAWLVQRRWVDPKATRQHRVKHRSAIVSSSTLCSWTPCRRTRQ